MRIPNKILSIILILTFAVGSLGFFPKPIQAASTWTQTTQADFLEGTISNIDLDVSPGDITLAENLNTYTDTTEDDFDKGNIGIDTKTQVLSTNQVSLNKGYSYSTLSTPAIANYYIYGGSWLDTTTNYLYVGTDDGLSVINTQGTTDVSDDTLVITYNTSSSPAIAHNSVLHSWLDTTTNYLYVSTNGGLSVINTQGTADVADDTLVITYNTSSSPAIASNYLRYNSWLDTNTDCLYVSTADGLSVINTQGTADVSDDTLVIHYKTSSTPAIASNNAYHSWLDTNTKYLYVSTFGNGLSVIDTQGTATTTDDALVITYNNSSSPAIYNIVTHSWLDTNTNYLYISTYHSGSVSGGGLSVINTQGTADVSDDTLVITYNTSSSPAIASNYVLHSWLDTNTNYLYVSAEGGLSVINTQGTADVSDDTLVIIYNPFSNPTTVSNSYARHSFIDSNTGNLYISTDGGLSVITPQYNNTGLFTSNVINTSITLSRVIGWDVTIPTNTSVSVQTRSGDSTSYWRDDFDDGDTSNVEDLWSGIWPTVSESGGILTLTGTPPNATWAGFQIDTGKSADYFPAGSVVKAKIRVNTDATNYEDWMFTDGWEDGDFQYSITDQWVTLTLIPSAPFSKIGFEPYWDSGTWQAGDTYEVDWVSVENTSGWGSWSDSYTNSYGSVIATTSEPYIQYKATLSTTSSSTTPYLNSVTIAKGYPSSGTYTSPAYETGLANHLELSYEGDVPASTEVSFQVKHKHVYKGDTWSDWIAYEDFSTVGDFTHIQYKANLVTSDSTVTPTLSSVTIEAKHVEAATSAPSFSGGAGVISPQTGGTITKAATEDSSFEVTVSVQSLPPSTSIKITPQEKAQVTITRPLPQGKQIAGNLVADYQATTITGQTITNLKGAAAITFKYTEDQIKDLKEESLKVYRWDEITNQWQELPTVTFNTQTNTITVSTMCFSLFALMGTPKIEEPTILDGDLIRNSDAKGPSQFDVYIVKLINPSAGSGQAAKKFKRLILSPHVFESYDHLDWNNIKLVDTATINSYTTSNIVRAWNPSGDLDDPKVYQLTPDGDTGTKQWLNMTAQEFTAAGHDWDSVYIINKTDRDAYTTGTPIIQ